MIRYKILEIERENRHLMFTTEILVSFIDRPKLPDAFWTKQEAVNYIIENKLKFVTIVEIYVAE